MTGQTYDFNVQDGTEHTGFLIEVKVLAINWSHDNEDIAMTQIANAPNFFLF